MELKILKSLILSLLIFYSSFAASAVEETTARKVLPLNAVASTVRENSERNRRWGIFPLPFPIKKSDDDSKEVPEAETSEDEERIREITQKAQSVVTQQYEKEKELQLGSPHPSIAQDPKIDSPAPMPSSPVLPGPSSSVQPAESPSDVSPKDEIPDASFVPPSPEVPEELDDDELDAMPSEVSVLDVPVPESTESVESWPTSTTELDEQPPVTQPPSSDTQVIASPIKTEEKSPESPSPIRSPLDTHLETLSSLPGIHEEEKEEDSEVSVPTDNKDRYHIGHKMKIVSWTLAGICISLVVVGNLLGIYFSYIHPRLHRNAEYTEL